MKKRLLLVLVLSLAALMMLHFAGRRLSFADTPEPPSPQSGTEPAGTPSAPAPTDILEGVILTRTPVPTATPGRVEQQVDELAETVGLAQTTLLGRSVVDWINLAISLLYALAGYLAGTVLIRFLLPLIAGRTQTEFDDQLLKSIGPDVRRLVVILTLILATGRLTFVSVSAKTVLGDVYFVVALILVVRITYKAIALADGWARKRMDEEGRGRAGVERATVLLSRTARVVTVGLALIILLSHFGIDVSALTATLGLSGLIITLGAQDAIADAIAGVIILVDRPFRVGDRIEIQGAGTWGDVVDIGLRSTRIQTRDNLVIIVPNSVVGNNQVMNYSYPDPRIRSETDLCVGYDSNIEEVRNLIIDTISRVDGVLDYRPVDALYVEMAPSGILLRARWWIRSYTEMRHNLDKVHTALQAAFDQAGIAFAPKTQSVRLHADAQTVQRVSAAFRRTRGEDTQGASDG
ncbi:mechanosensitive ion channel family protein [Chloroflexota bacterium]